jgi:ribosome-associated toxin RatA of RatAB toxin-antitoxin module
MDEKMGVLARTLTAMMALAVGLVAWASASAAQANSRGAATAPLGYFSASERALLSPYLDRGPLALVEFAEEPELPALLLAARVHAPAERVLDIVRDVKAYPTFMPALDDVRVKSRRGHTTAYEWTWRTAIFTLKGHNVMTEYPAPGGKSDRPHAFGVQSVRGDLGAGRFMWQVFPEGRDRCLVVLASRIDMRRANWVAEQLSGGGSGINRTINLSLAFLMLLSTKAEAEKGRKVPAVRSSPSLAVHRLSRLLRRGDLVLLDTSGGRLQGVRVLGRMGRREAAVRAVMTNPEAFGSALLQGSRARVVSRDGKGVAFDWEVPLPLVGSSGRMRLAERKNGVIAVDAVSGGLAGGKWRFAMHAQGADTVLVAWAQFDPGTISWLLRRLVDGVPYFNEGVAAASQVMVIRSIRTRVREQSGL